MTTSPAPVPVFPQPPAGYTQSYFATVLRLIAGMLANRSGPWDAQPFIHLVSPNGTVYRVTVSDAGALSTSVPSTTQPRPTT